MKRIPNALRAAGVPMTHLVPVAATLEDVFIQLLEMEGDNNGDVRAAA
jgi:hypothetical protein